MDDRQRALVRQAIENHREWAKTATKEEALAWLVFTGIYDEAGTLTPQYGGKEGTT